MHKAIPASKAPPVSANKVTGHLLYDGHQHYFRVYGEGGAHKDYLIAHSDLVVTIDDADAFFYETKVETPFYDGILDHSPATLHKG